MDASHPSEHRRCVNRRGFVTGNKNDRQDARAIWTAVKQLAEFGQLGLDLSAVDDGQVDGEVAFSHEGFCSDPSV